MNPNELRAVNRTGFDIERIPFTQGVPFGKNVLPVNANVELVDADGNHVPLQAEILATWTPRRLRVKWLLPTSAPPAAGRGPGGGVWRVRG